MKCLRFSNLADPKGQFGQIVTNRPQLDNLIEKHGFPPGRWMSPNCRIWFEDEVQEWLESRPIATENKPVNITDNHISRHPERRRKSGVAA
jgi:hypothetical protein